MILGISNLYYAPKFIKYFSYFTFEEMKILISLLYPCYIMQLSKLREMNLTLYLNLVPHMSNDQIRFLLSNCNIGFSAIGISICVITGCANCLASVERFK